MTQLIAYRLQVYIQKIYFKGISIFNNNDSIHKSEAKEIRWWDVKVASHITTYHIILKLIFREIIIRKFMMIRQLFHVKIVFKNSKNHHLKIDVRTFMPQLLSCYAFYILPNCIRTDGRTLIICRKSSLLKRWKFKDNSTILNEPKKII